MKSLVDTNQRKGPGKSWFTEQIEHLEVGSTLWVADGYFANANSIRGSVAQVSRRNGKKYSTRKVDDGFWVTRLS